MIVIVTGTGDAFCATTAADRWDDMGELAMNEAAQHDHAHQGTGREQATAELVAHEVRQAKVATAI